MRRDPVPTVRPPILDRPRRAYAVDARGVRVPLAPAARRARSLLRALAVVDAALLAWAYLLVVAHGGGDGPAYLYGLALAGPPGVVLGLVDLAACELDRRAVKARAWIGAVWLGGFAMVLLREVLKPPDAKGIGLAGVSADFAALGVASLLDAVAALAVGLHALRATKGGAGADPVP